ncbi:MAG: hypothetical protein NTX45_10405 [Proteobacteria bacterium]|nr:hypothetical protein [Pseudomonadota bacterium]
MPETVAERPYSGLPLINQTSNPRYGSIAVIPAGMQESSAMDGDMSVA